MKKTSPTKHKKSEQLDPDVRFLLANERTLLAWVRTALALLAGGLALTQFGENSTSTSYIGISVIFMGAVMTCIGLVRFRAADTAIRRGQLPAAGQGPQIQVMAVVTFAAVLIAVEIFHII